MKLDDFYICQPRYFEMLISATGLLSNADRVERIKSIAKRNIWLAARCKNTCVNEENEIEEWLIRRCVLLYQKFEDIQAIVALFELREYGIISDIFGILTKSGGLTKDIIKLWEDCDQSMSHAFIVISEHLPIDLAIRLFNRFIELGYLFESNCYNTIISRLRSAEEIDRLMTQMTSSGIEANAETYYHLARKSDSWESAYMNYKSFLTVCNSQTDKYLIVNMHIIMIKKSKDLQQVSFFYNQLQSFNLSEPPFFELVYFAKAIELSHSRKEYTIYYRQFHMQYINKNTYENFRKKQKRLFETRIMHVVTAYLDRLALEHMPINDTINCFKEVVPQLIEMGIKQGKVYNGLVKPMSLVINEQNRYIEGKQFIEAMQIHQINQFCYYELLKKSSTIDEVKDALQGIGFCDNQKCSPKLMDMFKPNDITKLLARGDEKIAEYLYEVLLENDYSMNLIIFNVLIKQLPLNKCFEVIDSMLLLGIHPDIQSIQPMLRKWDNTNGLIRILQIANNNCIEPDKQSVLAIIKQTQKCGLQVPMIDMYINEKNTFPLQIGKTWTNTLSTVCNALI